MISDDDGLGNFSIIWQRSSTKTDWQAFPEINGEVRLSQRRIGYSYRAVVSTPDGHGTSFWSPVETVQNVDDPVQGEVLIGKAEGRDHPRQHQRVRRRRHRHIVGWEASTDGNWRTIETAGATQLALSLV